MSFEDAMKKAIVSKADPEISKWGVEVFLRVPFQGESSYKQSYKPISPEQLRDAAGITSKVLDFDSMPDAPRHVPFTGTSTTHDHYAPPPVTPLKDRQPGYEAPSPAPHVPFEGMSQYKRTYTAPQPECYSSPYNTPVKNPDPAEHRVPFTGTSTAAEHYKAPPASAYSRGAPDSPGLEGSPGQVNPRVRFEGKTSYQDTYVPHAIKPELPAGLVANADEQPYLLCPDDRTFETASAATYKAPPMTRGIDVMADREGRLQVYVDRDACVGDLKRVLEELTAIPMPDQHLVRRGDGQTLRDERERLLDGLGWTSGEELTLTVQEEEQRQVA